MAKLVYQILPYRGCVWFVSHSEQILVSWLGGQLILSKRDGIQHSRTSFAILVCLTKSGRKCIAEVNELNGRYKTGEISTNGTGG
jgi:hypothetical protein